MRLAALALAVATGVPGVAPAPPTTPSVAPPEAARGRGALTVLADRLAAEVGPPVDGRRAAALLVETRAPGLAAPLGAALDAALASRGWVVTPLRAPGADAETAARASGQDWLVRVQAGLVPGRRELVAVAEVIPAWPSFFLQRRPGARALPPRVVRAGAEADGEAAFLAREARPPGAPFASFRPIGRVAGRVLALAVGEPGAPGAPAIAAVTAGAVLVLSPRGELLARRDLDPAARRPVRGEAAVVAVGDLGGGRIAYQHAGAGAAEVLALEPGGRLAPVATLPMAPLCAGEGGVLFGAFAPGTALLRDLLSPAVDSAAAPRSGRLLYGVAASPRSGPVAHAALGADLRLELLGPRLATVATLDGVGSGFALADLDGDGTAEVVASSGDPDAPDRLRVLAPRPGAAPLLEGAPLAGNVLAGAGGDLTGDGVDDAVMGEVEVVEGSASTLLWLVTSDPRAPGEAGSAPEVAP